MSARRSVTLRVSRLGRAKPPPEDERDGREGDAENKPQPRERIERRLLGSARNPGGDREIADRGRARDRRERAKGDHPNRAGDAWDQRSRRNGHRQGRNESRGSAELGQAGPAEGARIEVRLQRGSSLGRKRAVQVRRKIAERMHGLTSYP